MYIRGSGDGNIIGREMKFHLWFDPTKDYHNYAILWDPNEIMLVYIFLKLVFFAYGLIFLVFFINSLVLKKYVQK